MVRHPHCRCLKVYMPWRKSMGRHTRVLSMWLPPLVMTWFDVSEAYLEVVIVYPHQLWPSHCDIRCQTHSLQAEQLIDALLHLTSQNWAHRSEDCCLYKPWIYSRTGNHETFPQPAIEVPRTPTYAWDSSILTLWDSYSYHEFNLSLLNLIENSSNIFPWCIRV